MTVRECKLCKRMVDFSEPWCDHETMEESAWLDILERQNAATKASLDKLIDEAVIEAAKDLMKGNE
jgi:hypothetical protein